MLAKTVMGIYPFKTVVSMGTTCSVILDSVYCRHSPHTHPTLYEELHFEVRFGGTSGFTWHLSKLAKLYQKIVNANGVAYD